MRKIALIQSYLPSGEVWKNLLTLKKIPELSVEQILDKYQGFEGECIALYVLENNELEQVVDLFINSQPVHKYKFLYLSSDSKASAEALRDLAYLVGYDIGICDEDRTIYSSIFNEILFGYFDELIAFRDHLNENLLFPDQSISEKYLAMHETLAAEGKGVEEGVEMTIYQVWKFKNK